MGIVLAGSIAAALAAAYVAHKSNKNASMANDVRNSLLEYLNPYLYNLDSVSSKLNKTLRETKILRENALLRYSNATIHYLSTVKCDGETKDKINNEITQISCCVKEYYDNITSLVNQGSSENAMLISAASGGVALGAASLGASLTGTGLSLGLGLSFFGAGSLVASLFMYMGSKANLEKMQTLYSNRTSMAKEIENKIILLNGINKAFNNYNDLLNEQLVRLSGYFDNFRLVYNERVYSSKRNIRRIARGKPVRVELNENELKDLYKVTEFNKVVNGIARVKLLTSSGQLDNKAFKKLGIAK